MRYLAFTLILFVLSGCSPKEEFRRIVNNDSIYTNAISYTKKATLKQKGETEVILTATYINELYPYSFNDGEYFFVGVYAQNGDNTLNTQYFLTLLDADPLSIEKADPVQFKNLPLLNQWTTYYLVKFEKIENIDLNLRFGNETLGYETFTIVKDRSL